MRKPLLMLLAGTAVPFAAAANSPPPRPDASVVVREAARSTPPARRRPVQPAATLPVPPPPAPPLPFITDLAPMPNRSIEAPPERFARRVGPTLEPAIIDQRDRRRGFTFGSEHLRDVQDRGLADLVPGARLRIPLD